jgi:FkbM family methyltransferase
MRDIIKRRLVGTWLGQVMSDAADSLALRLVSTRNPEMASLRANHIIARRLLRGLCPANGLFVDVGAHIGSVLSAVHRENETVQIAAIEADPEKAAFLRDKYPYAKVFACAVGETSGSAMFFIDDRASGYNSLSGDHRTATRQITVSVMRLDELLSAEKPDLIKLDVEGAELGVLRGAEQLVARARPVIMFESTKLQDNALGYGPGMVWDWFAARDYEIRPPDRVAHDSPALTRESFLDRHCYPFQTFDYFAAPLEKRDAVRSRARHTLGVIVD